MPQISQVLEIIMMIAFGLSWPNNIATSLKNKSTKGKSLAFLLLIDTGYVCGIIGKILSKNAVWYVLFFYILNFVMVTTDIVLYFHYYFKEKKQ